MLYEVNILIVWDNHCPYIINYFLSFWTCSWDYDGLNIIDTQGYVTFLSSTCRICVLYNWNRSEITSYLREDGKSKTKRIWPHVVCSFYSYVRDSNMSTCSNYRLKALASYVLCLPADASNELAILLTSAIIATKSLSLFTAEPTPCVHTW